MKDEPPRRQEAESAGARTLFIEWLIARLAVWLQIAAAIWLTGFPSEVLPPLLPSADDIIRWASWFVMAAGGLVLLGIAYRQPKLRYELAFPAFLWLAVLFLRLA